MKKQMKTFIIIIFSFLSWSSYAQEDMYLEKAISVALENNYGIKIDDQFIQIAENNDTWARAGKTPTIDLNGTFNNGFTRDNNPASFLQGTYYNGSLGGTLDAQWVVYSGGRVKISKEQLMMAVDQQKLNKESGIHNLLRIINQQYYAIVFAQEQLEVLQSSLDLSKSRLAYEETKRDFGASNSYNLIQFQNAIISDSTNVIRQVQSVETAKRNLYNTLDIEGFPNYNFPERLGIVPEQINMDKLKEILSEENYTLKSLDLIANLNQLNTELQESARKPAISVRGSFGFSENGFNFFADNPQTGEPFPFTFSNRLTGSLTATANYNLYDGGVRKTNIQNAILQEEIDQYGILEATVELYNQLDILADNYANQIELLNLSDEQIRLAERNLEITEERFKAGQVTSIDFRNIQIQYLSAAFNKVNAIYSLILTKASIDDLVGKYGNT